MGEERAGKMGGGTERWEREKENERDKGGRVGSG